MTTETAALEATPATAAPKAKKAKGKKAAKAKAAKAAPAAKANGGLTGNEVKILTALTKSNKPLTRDQLRSKTGINKGWSRVLGAATKDDGGVNADASLEGRGYVKADKPEGQRTLEYTVTAAGRKALEKAKNA